MLFNIVGDQELYKNVKYGYLPVFAEAFLRLAEMKLCDLVIA